MTNSTTSTEKSKDKKDRPRKGPFRTEAIIPVAIVFVIIFTYITFFFDSHLKRGLEWTGTHIHGAEVNIGTIQTSFTKGSLLLGGLQITDKKEPTRNLIQVERIHFQFLWDALLRAKFVVDKAIVENVQMLIPRKKPGRVLPQKDDESAVVKVKQAFLNQTKDQFSENGLSDVVQILDGKSLSEQGQNIQSELKLDAKVKKLEETFNEKQKLWHEQLNSLSKGGRDVEKKAKNTRFDKTPLKTLKKVDQLFHKSHQTIKSYDKVYRNINGDIKKFNVSLKELENLGREDLKHLQERFKIPDVKMGVFSVGLFGHLFQENVATVKKYMDMGRRYMPPKKTTPSKASEISPPRRSGGRNFPFKITTGYPLFWLKQGRFSSGPSESGDKGTLSGEIKDLTSNPPVLGRPAIITLKGDFPKQQVMGLHAQLTVDHTTEDPSETLKITISSYPVGKQKLFDNKDVQLALREAQGSTEIQAALKNKSVNIQITNWFKNFSYEIKTESKSVEEILANVLRGLPHIYVKSHAIGNWNDLDLKFNSNLGGALVHALQAQLDIKVREAKSKLKKSIDEKIKAHKNKLRDKLNRAKTQLMDELAKVKSTTKNMGKGKRVHKKIEEKLKRKGQKALKKLLGI